MSLIYWIIFGLLAGFVANFFMPNSRGGIIGLLVIGIIGAVVGGYLGDMLFGVGVTGFNVSSFIVAVIGSILVLFVSGMIFRRSGV